MNSVANVLRVKLICSIQAKNVTNYLRVIHNILAPGGVWINLGKGPRSYILLCILSSSN